MKSGFAWISVVALLVGCSNKAAPKLKECVDAETRGDLKAAIAACEDGARLDPRSAAGREARARAEMLKAKEEARRKESDALKQPKDGKDGRPCNCHPADPLCDCNP